MGEQDLMQASEGVLHGARIFGHDHMHAVKRKRRKGGVIVYIVRYCTNTSEID